MLLQCYYLSTKNVPFCCLFFFGFQTFEVLGSIESTIKGLRTQTVQLTELAKKHEELHRSIKDAASEPLQRGQLILQKLSPQR